MSSRYVALQEKRIGRVRGGNVLAKQRLIRDDHHLVVQEPIHSELNEISILRK